MEKFAAVKKQIEKILPDSPIQSDPHHAELVLKWVLKLKPDADEALQIAALSHDIDRAVNKITEKDLLDSSKFNEFKKEHSVRSAKIICNILKEHQYSQKVIEKVQHLVENHEFGGDAETDILKDADSIAYFEYNIPFYLKDNSPEKTSEKIRFMYRRMSSNAKKLVGQLHFEDAKIKKLFEEAISKP